MRAMVGALFLGLLVLPLSAVEMQVANGFGYSLLLDADGRLWAWGKDTGNGKLGLGGASASTAQLMEAGSLQPGLLAVAAGAEHSLALRSDGTVWAWGDNSSGQLGNGGAGSYSLTPVQVTHEGGGALFHCIAVAAGKNWSLALDREGGVWSWGAALPVLGAAGTTRETAVAARVLDAARNPLSDIVAISAGEGFALALQRGGLVYAWGDNSQGQCGRGDADNTYDMAQLVQSDQQDNLAGIKAIAAGSQHALALNGYGQVLVWGRNNVGQIGLAVDSHPLVKEATFCLSLPTGVPIRSIAAGLEHSAVLSAAGTLWTSGNNNEGQLGHGGVGSWVDYFKDVAESAGGVRVLGQGSQANRTVIIAGNGSVWAMGDNDQGALGNGGGSDSGVPVEANLTWPLTGLMQVTGGSLHSLALKADGSVWAWGENISGQLGDAGSESRSFAEPVRDDRGVPLSDIRAIASFADHSLALQCNGRVWAWGRGSEGQIGYDDRFDEVFNVAVPVRWDEFQYLENVIALATGAYHSLALDGMGQVHAWGDGREGQLGEGSGTASGTPMMMYLYDPNVGSAPVAGLTAGAVHSLVQTVDGLVWACGADDRGQQGNGSGTAAQFMARPVTSVQGGRQVVAGWEHLLVQGDGGYFAWGANASGQLGNGSATEAVHGPIWIDGDQTPRLLAAGWQTSYALNASGQAWAWGNGDFGRLGNGDSSMQVQPVPILDDATGNQLINMTGLAGGGYHGLALDARGAAWAWGGGGSGQLGQGKNEDRFRAIQPLRLWQPSIEIRASDTAAYEANVGNTGHFRIERSNDWPSHGQGQVTVQLEVVVGSGAATAGSDYVALPQQVVIPSGVFSVDLVVTAIDDGIDEDNETVTVRVLPHASYRRLSGSIQDVVTIYDNDTAGFVFGGATDDIISGEDGDTATIQLRPASQPQGTVVVTIQSSNSSEGQPTVSSLSWDATDWLSFQTITVTGIDDAIDDGDVAYWLILDVDSNNTTAPQYQTLNPNDVPLTNHDDGDAAGFVISAISGPLHEAASSGPGYQESFTVRLASQPTAPVEIPIASSDLSEGTLALSQLVFGVASWNVDQTVTVTRVNDAGDDGDIAFTIQLGQPTTSDNRYQTLDPNDVAVTCIDDDTAGYEFQDPGGGTAVVVVSEGTSIYDSYQMRLTSQPAAALTIGLNSLNGQVTVSPASLSFSPTNWNAWQTVQVTAAVDGLIEGTHGGSVVHTGFGAYSGINQNLSVMINDDDAYALAIGQNTLTVIDGGSAATVGISLRGQPAAGATVEVVPNVTALTTATANDASQIAVTPPSLLFTNSNWNTPQLLNVAPTADADGGQDTQQSIGFSWGAGTNDTGFAAAPAPTSTITVTNYDASAYSILVAQSGGQTQVDESGTTDTVTVTLSQSPTNDVLVGFVSDPDLLFSLDSGSTWVTTANFTLSSSNWSSGQEVHIRALNDAIDEAGETTSVSFAKVGGSDVNTWVSASVAVEIIDNDSAAIAVSPTGGISITENGGQTIFTVVLATEPTGMVRIDAQSLQPLEGLVQGESPGTPLGILFTPADWNIPRIVTVLGQDEAIDDGDQDFLIDLAINAGGTSDATYGALDVPDVTITCIDDDVAGVTLSGVDPAVLSEGGSGTTYSVRLNAQPAAGQSVSLAVNPGGQLTATPASLVFTLSDWNITQTVTVGTQDDAIAEGLHSGTIGHLVNSGDPAYAGLPAPTLTYQIDDTAQDIAGVTVQLKAGSATASSEDGGRVEYEVWLDSQPTTTVNLVLASDDPSEGVVSPVLLSFGPGNWDASQRQVFSVTGIDDQVADGAIAYTISIQVSSGDGVYNALAPSPLTLNNNDNDLAGILIIDEDGNTVRYPDGSYTGLEQFSLSEDSEYKGFGFLLTSEPTADITFDLSVDSAEVFLDPSSLTFTADNWFEFQWVAVISLDDDLADGDQLSAVTAVISSTDVDYAALSDPQFSVTTLDDDSAGIQVSPTSGLVTSESGGTASFNVSLLSQPYGTVGIDLSSSDTSEGTIDISSLSFTSANWSTPRAITVTGVDDAVADGSVTYTVQTDPAISTVTSEAYHGMDAADVSVVNEDDDAATGVQVAVTVEPTYGLSTSESGATASFTVVLQSVPSTDVVIPMSVDDATEASLAVSALTFTTDNWNVPQTVVVTGKDDGVEAGDAPDQLDGDVHYYVLLAAVISADTNWNGIAVPDVEMLNRDSDRPGLLVSESDGQTAIPEVDVFDPAFHSDTLTFRLSTAPTAPVVITFDDQYTTWDLIEFSTDNATWSGAASFTFTASDWATPQTVYLRMAPDYYDDPALYTEGLVISASSTDAAYDSGGSFIDPGVTVTITDNDTVGITVDTPSGLQTTEIGGTTTVAVSLATTPWEAVQLVVSVDQPGQVLIENGTVLDFDLTNWNLPQSVTLRGLDTNNTDDGNVPFTLTIAPHPANTLDDDYRALSPPMLAGENLAVNHQPTIALVGGTPQPYILGEDQGLQVINLDGIGPGQAGETDALSLSVTTDTPSLITGLSADYTSPNTTGAFSFTPAPGLGGTASVTVTITDDAATPGDPRDDRSQAVILNIEIASENDPPVLSLIATQSVAEDTPLSLPEMSVVDGDVGAGLLEVRINTFQNPSLTIGDSSGITFLGSANGNANLVFEGTQSGVNAALASLTYQGAPDFNGSDTLDIWVDDRGNTGLGGPLSDNGTVIVSVTPINDVPIIELPPPPTVPEDGALAVAGVGVSDADAGTVLTVTLSVSSGVLSVPSATGITWQTGDGSNDASLRFSAALDLVNLTLAAIEYVPQTDYTGSDNLVITVDDGVAAAVSGSLPITVTSINDLPQLNVGGALTVAAKQQVVLNADPLDLLRASDVEDTDSTLVYVLLLAPSSGTLIRDNGDGTTTDLHTGTGDPSLQEFTQADLDAGRLRYRHNGGTSREDGFAVRVRDGTGGQSALQVVDIAIDFTSLPPQLTISDAQPTYTENADGVLLANSTTVALSDADSADFDAGRLTLSLAVTDGQPDAGDRLFVSPVGSGSGQIDVVAGQVRYENIPIGNISGGEGRDPLVIDFLNDGDEGQSLVLVQAVRELVRRLAFRHEGEAPSAVARLVQIELLDGDGGIGDVIETDVDGNTRTIPVSGAIKTITVLPVNDAPSAQAQTVLTAANLPLTGRLLASDPDSVSLTFAIQVNPSLGTVRLDDATTGAFTYIPIADASGSDGFSFTVSDDAGAISTSATVTLAISSPDAEEVPELTSDPPMSLGEGDQLIYGLTTAGTAASDQLSFQLLGGVPAGMAVQAAADGSASLVWEVDLSDPALLPSTSGKYLYLKITVLVSDAASGTSSYQTMIMVFHAPTEGDG